MIQTGCLITAKETGGNRERKVTARGWEDRKWGVACGGVGLEAGLKERIACRAKASLGLREAQSPASSDARNIF